MLLEDDNVNYLGQMNQLQKQFILVTDFRILAGSELEKQSPLEEENPCTGDKSSYKDFIFRLLVLREERQAKVMKILIFCDSLMKPFQALRLLKRSITSNSGVTCALLRQHGQIAQNWAAYS